MPSTERPISARDLGLRLLAGEPAEFEAPDADARQDPAVVLLTPRVQGAHADADRGRQLYMSNCATCHGQTAQGMPRQGVQLRASMRIPPQVSAVLPHSECGRVAARIGSLPSRTKSPATGNR